MTHTEKLSILRKETDGVLRMTELVKASAYTTLCKRDLEMAKFWMGQTMGALGNSSPYIVPEKDREDPLKIPATSDVYEGEITVSANHLRNINQIRDNIQILLDNFNKNLRYQDPLTLQVDKQFYMDQIQIFLIQAKGRLGFELASIREEARKGIPETVVIPEVVAPVGPVIVTTVSSESSVAGEVIYDSTPETQTGSVTMETNSEHDAK